MRFVKDLRGTHRMRGLWNSGKRFVISWRVSGFAICFWNFMNCEDWFNLKFVLQRRMGSHTRLIRYWLAMEPSRVFSKPCLQFVLLEMRSNLLLIYSTLVQDLFIYLFNFLLEVLLRLWVRDKREKNRRRGVGLTWFGLTVYLHGGRLLRGYIFTVYNCVLQWTPCTRIRIILLVLQVYGSTMSLGLLGHNISYLLVLRIS